MPSTIKCLSTSCFFFLCLVFCCFTSSVENITMYSGPSTIVTLGPRSLQHRSIPCFLSPACLLHWYNLHICHISVALCKILWRLWDQRALILIVKSFCIIENYSINTINSLHIVTLNHYCITQSKYYAGNSWAKPLFVTSNIYKAIIKLRRVFSSYNQLTELHKLQPCIYNISSDDYCLKNRCIC